jgi:hypothetical protein
MRGIVAELEGADDLSVAELAAKVYRTITPTESQCRSVRRAAAELRRAGVVGRRSRVLWLPRDDPADRLPADVIAADHALSGRSRPTTAARW